MNDGLAENKLFFLIGHKTQLPLCFTVVQFNLLQTLMQFWLYFQQVFRSDLSCQIGHAILGTAQITSSWYIIFVTLERLITVYFPVKVR